jgi:hypothetical protein
LDPTRPDDCAVLSTESMKRALHPRILISGIAEVDRRVQVIDGSEDQRDSIRRVSDLRPAPFVVLLGEPGIGKSTVFGVEAAWEGARS